MLRFFIVSVSGFLPQLAFDHADIIHAALERIKRDIHFEPIGFDLLDEEFTIPDLQRLYEIILGVKFDRRNFQRKILSSGILEEAEEPVEYCCAEPERPMSAAEAKPRRRPGRIASLFRLNKAKYMEMKEEGNKLEF